MQDFIKLINDDASFIEQVYNSKLLSLYKKTKSKSKNNITEQKAFNQAKEIKVYKGIYFLFYSKRLQQEKHGYYTKVEILIKPHYYYNDNEHNANDFTALECIKTLKEISYLFNFQDYNLSVINNEFGVNLSSVICCKELIEYTYYHGRNIFSNVASLPYAKESRKIGLNGKPNNYKIIKFYNKGIQYPQHTDVNTLRFEVKSRESEYIKTLGVKFYDDLLKPRPYLKMKKTLLDEFDKILIIYAIDDVSNLTKKEQDLLKEFLNPIYWSKSLRRSRNVFNENKKKYFKLLDKTGFNIHTEIKKELINKLDFLTKGIETNSDKTKKVCTLETPQKTKKVCTLDTIYNSKLHTIDISETSKDVDVKKCLVTGVNISMQKEQSRLLSNTGLKFLEKHNNKKFVFLIRTLITGKPNRFEKDIYSKISKQIRNRYRYKSQQMQPTLF